MAICSSLNLPDIPTGLRREAAVLAAVEDQRIAVVAFHAFDFAEEDGVIAGGMFGDDVAGQFGEGAIEERNAAGGPAIANAEASMLFRGLFEFGEILGEGLLPFAQNADAEAALGFEVGEKPGVMADAGEDQKRFERNGSEGIGGHAVDKSGFALSSNYGDACCKCACDSTKRYGIERR